MKNAKVSEKGQGLKSEFPLLTSNEVAAIIRIEPGTLYTWRTLGKGPKFFKVGHHVKYRQEDVDLWLAAQVPCASTAESQGLKNSGQGSVVSAQ